MPQKDWSKAMTLLLRKCKGKKHPLEYKSIYQLVVMVILSAQDSDRNINQLAPKLFENFPNIQSLGKASAEDLYPFIGKVRNFANKAKWLAEMGQKIKKDSNIPLTMDDLTALPGIGRKSANVIRREAGEAPEGVIVDLHVVRVAPRLGIATGADPKKIEKQIMEAIPEKLWDAGMAMSFHGREICRPQPKCDICFMTEYCDYYKENFG